MKKCDNCGKRAEGLGTVPTAFGSIVLCSTCYEGLSAFKNGRKFKSVDEVVTKKRQTMEEMQNKQFPPMVMEQVSLWFDERKDVVVQKTLSKQFEKDITSYMMTTGYTFEGYNIVAYHGIIGAESVLGTGFLSSFDASVSDMFGYESESFMGKLKEARTSATKRAVERAVAAGGNAVIGVDIDYTMFGNNLIGVIFNGTSVTIEKIEE